MRVRPVGLPDLLDVSLRAAGVLLAVAVWLPAAADEERGVRLVELLDPIWGGLAIVLAFASAAGLLFASTPLAGERSRRAGLGVACVVAAGSVLVIDAEARASLLPGPLAALGLVGLSSAVAVASIAAAFLMILSRDRSGHESRVLATLSTVSTLVVVSPITVILAAGARTAASSRADVHAVLGLRAGALALAAILVLASALFVWIEARLDADTPAEADDGPRLPSAVTRVLAAGLVATSIVHATAVTFAATPIGPRPRDAEPWMVALYRDALPALAETIARGREGDASLDDVLDALDAATQLASREPRLRRAIEHLAETIRWGVPSATNLARAEDRVNRAAEALGVPFFIDVHLARYDGVKPMRERVYILSYRTVRLRTSRAPGSAEVRTWWLERADSVPIVEQRLGWTRAGRSECSVILDVVRRRIADELAPELAAFGGIAEPALVERLASNVEAHEVQHVLDVGRIRA
ncbi:hypothetical protein L6R52_28305, partial [Myxococcota bacterium]|nr:hypothetical protein [Myxococcota bacterium]